MGCRKDAGTWFLMALALLAILAVSLFLAPPVDSQTPQPTPTDFVNSFFPERVYLPVLGKQYDWRLPPPLEKGK